ncbi:MAG: DNA cytosine methyltransferase [Planctomycetota bacterium]|nr:DNA cytosine methyltransferase [Planctomycetota bacterium]
MNNEAICWFCGPGGSSEGAEQADLRVLAGVDRDEWARETHLLNLPGAKVFDFDLMRLTDYSARSTDLAREWIRACGVADPDAWEGLHVFTAPCPGFSNAGKMRLDDPRNRLVFTMLPILAATPRSRLIFENVPMFLARKFQPIHDELFGSLARLGRGHIHPAWLKRYIVVGSDHGLAQCRRRLLFPVMQQGEAYPSSLRPSVLRERVLEDAIGAGFADPDPYHHALTSIEGRMVRPVQPGENWKAAIARDAFVREYADEHRWFEVEKPTGTLRVMGWHEAGSTVVASTDFHISRVEPLHPDKRRFTAGEKARLQAFPAHWIILGSPDVRSRLIGDAVPPELMRQAIEAYFGHLIEA